MDWSLYPKRFSIPLAVLILQLFLFISADKIYGGGAETAKSLLLAYMIMTVSVTAYTGVRPDAVKGSFNPLNFFIFFIGSSIIFLALPILTGLSSFATLGVASAIQYGLIQSFVVAYTEETVFRGVLPKVLGSDVVPAVLFGLFHWAVSGSWFFIIFATFAGLMFAYIRDHAGLYASMGVHSAFNLKALGLLERLVRGG